MTATTIQQLQVFGPERCETLTVDQARAMCRRLTTGSYENFTVLSAVVPHDLHDDFSALYAFCRWADDLGDEVGDPHRSMELLQWWRRELDQCFAGAPRHPVFTALLPVIARHDLPREPFDNLLDAFEQDQRVGRYATWADLIAYCRRSANPVGRLVLMICGERRDEVSFARSDDLCTALQLTNHWQDVRRDILERDRIYLPRELTAAPDFEARLIASARAGHGMDQRFLPEFRTVLKACVDRTWPLYERGDALLDMLGERTRPIVWLLARGGRHVLQQVEAWNYETALHRPTLGRISRAGLVVRAWLMGRVRGRERRYER